MPSSSPATGAERASRVRAAVALVVVALATVPFMLWADRSTSVTFDEPVLSGIGARAVLDGDLGMLEDQPPLLPLLQGVAIASVGAELPAPPPGVERWDYSLRYVHGRALLFGSGNDPRRLITAARTVSMAFVLVLVLAVGAWAWSLAGPAAGVLAGVLVAALPDVLGHGAVAYNDLPLAPAFLAAAWAADHAARNPSPRTGALFGSAFGLAMGIKYSAIAIVPVAVLCLGLEAWGRGGVRWSAVARAALAAAVAFWAVTAAMWGGDVGLERFLEGFWFQMRHAAGGHPAPAWFAGATSPDGWWWWFPAAYLVKVPVGMQLLTLGVVLFGARAMVGEGARRGFALAARGWASDPLRAPLAGVAVYGAFLLRSDLNIGFRYAIPLLPLVCVAVGAGVVRAARTPSWVALLGVSTLVALQLSSTLSAAPHFLAFESVWARGRPPGEEVLLDSSRDWGQGLVALRRWMDEEGVEAVDLSYFGSALPEGYGIAYRSLPSFLPLPPSAGLAEGGPAPTWTAISATNLVGLYLAGDPLAEWRSRPPDHSVAGGTIYLWRGGVP